MGTEQERSAVLLVDDESSSFARSSSRPSTRTGVGAADIGQPRPDLFLPGPHLHAPIVRRRGLRRGRTAQP